MKKTFEQIIDEARNVSLSSAEKQNLKSRIMQATETFDVPSELEKPGFFSFFQIHLASSVVAAAFILLFATGAFAEGSLPGNMLYPVKTQVNEQIRGWFVFSGNAQAELELDLAQRRLDEIEKLTDRSLLTDDTKREIEDKFVIHTGNVERQLLDKVTDDSGDSPDDSGFKMMVAVPVSESFSTGLSARTESVAAVSVDKESTEKILNEVKSQIEELEKVIKNTKKVSAQSKISARLLLVKTKRVFIDGKVRFSEKDYTGAVTDFEKALAGLEEVALQVKNFPIADGNNSLDQAESSDKDSSDDFIQAVGEDGSVINIKLRGDGTADDDQSDAGGPSPEVRGASNEIEFGGDQPKQEDRREDRREDGGGSRSGSGDF